MRRRRAIPMPTEEEKRRAKLKATSADPLVWAMKSVDERFPDTREKSAEIVKAESEIENKMGPVETGDEVVEEPQVNVNPQMVAESSVDDSEAFDDVFDDDFGDDDLLDDEILNEPTAENSAEMINALSESKKAEKAAAVEEAKKETGVVDPNTPLEIKAEDKLTMPTQDGVVTMEVTSMRQNVSGVSPEEVRKTPVNEEPTLSEEDAHSKVKDKAKINKPKRMNLDFKQKKMMVGLAALSIVAVVGVCFGVVATVKQSQATEELKNQIAAANNGSTQSEETDEEYINLKDWNVKIKIVDGLNNVSYNTIMDDYAEVQIWGSRRDAGANYVPDFVKQSKNSSPLGTMVRVPRYERAAAGRLIWYDDYYNYYYQGPSGVPKVSEDEMSWWVESYLLIKEMLTNADNYTTGN